MRQQPYNSNSLINQTPNITASKANIEDQHKIQTPVTRGEKKIHKKVTGMSKRSTVDGLQQKDKQRQISFRKKHDAHNSYIKELTWKDE